MESGISDEMCALSMYKTNRVLDESGRIAYGVVMGMYNRVLDKRGFWTNRVLDKSGRIVYRVVMGIHNRVLD